MSNIVRPLGHVGKLAGIYPFYKVNGQSIDFLLNAISSTSYDILQAEGEEPAFELMSATIPYLIGFMQSVQDLQLPLVRLEWDDLTKEPELKVSKLVTPFGDLAGDGVVIDVLQRYVVWSEGVGATDRPNSLQLFNSLILASFRYKQFEPKSWDDFCDAFWTGQAQLCFRRAVEALVNALPEQNLAYHSLLSRVDWLNVGISKICSQGRLLTASFSTDLAAIILKQLKPPDTAPIQVSTEVPATKKLRVVRKKESDVTKKKGKTK